MAHDHSRAATDLRDGHDSRAPRAGSALLVLVACLATLTAACADLWGIKDVPTAGADASTAGSADAATGRDGASGSESDAPYGGADAGDATTGQAADGGPGTSTCTDPCTMGATQCAAGGSVQTCEVQPNGCTSWVTTKTCGSNQSCAVSGGAAACSCAASICTQAGTVCQDGQTVATCATDADACLYVTSTSACTPPMSCSGEAPTAACSATCSNSCAKGQTACVSGALATCTLGTNGCYAYGTPVACNAHQACAGAAGNASCGCSQDPVCVRAAGPTCASASTLATCSQDTQGCIFESATTPCTGGGCTGDAGAASCCTNACTAGATQCGTTGVETCQTQADGCTAWVPTTTCGPHETCATSGGAATCTCNPSICTRTGAVCENSTTVANCSTDANSCLYVSSTSAPCTSPEVCSGSAPNAQCGLTCSNSCTPNQKSCISGGLATCTLGSNGCYAYGTPVACGTHQSCTGSAGSAVCSCNAAAACSGVTGASCESAQTLVTCAKDAQGCIFESAIPTQCTGGACTGAAGSATCCTNACTAGTTECGASGVETCQTQASGCTAWVPTTTCGPHETCTVTGGAAACTCNASVCTRTGAVCENSTTVANCSTDANGCLYVSSTNAPCTSPEVCSGSAPNAQCTLTCTSSCTQGQTSCVSAGIATCTLGSNGCYSYGTGTPCGTHQTCAGPSGNAACSCNASVCTSTANACESTTTYATCAKDGQGCYYSTGAGSCGQPENATVSCSNGTCQYTCENGYAACGGSASNGCTTDLSTDVNNCGRCGHACGAGGCSDGVCQAWTILSGNDVGILGDLAADANYVYWTTWDGVSSTGSLRQAPVAGGSGSYVTLASGIYFGTSGLSLQMNPSPTGEILAASEGGVNFCAASIATLGSWACNTSQLTDFVSQSWTMPASTAGSFYLLVDDGSQGGANYELFQCSDSFPAAPTCGQPLLQVTQEYASAMAGIPASNTVFVLQGDSTGVRVVGWAPGAASPSTVAGLSVTTGPTLLATDGTSLYWVDGTTMMRARAAVVAQTPTAIATSLDLSVVVSDLATDGVNLYFAANGPGAPGLYYLPVGGAAEPTLLAAALSPDETPYPIRVANGWIYWFEVEGSSTYVIRRIATP